VSVAASAGHERASSAADIRFATSAADVALARSLFVEYAKWLDYDLCFQGFEQELAGLPGAYALPRDPHEAHAIRPRMDRLFDCLENVRRRCPEGCNKRLPLNSIILHLNDDHHWTREQIVDWLKKD